MARKKYVKKRKRDRKRGRGIPYIYKNGIYFGKKPQTGTGVVSKVIARLLENVGSTSSYLMVKRKYVLRIKFKRKTHRRKKIKKNKKHGKGFGDGFKLLYSIGKQWRNSMQ